MNLTSRIFVGAIVAALPALAQTAAEQLQKGIFAQESQGKTDDAITIYRQLANSTLTPREIAAQAQYRLSQSLLQKGDIATATREMERLERDFSEYRNLISSLVTSRGVHGIAPPGGPPPRSNVQYNSASGASVRGKVKRMEFVNPVSWLYVDADGKEYRIELTSPNSLMKIGVRRDTFPIGDEVIATGSNAADGTPTLFAHTVTSSDGRSLYDRSKLSPEEMKRIEETIAREAAAKAQQGK